MRLQEKKLGLMMELMDEEFPTSSSSSSVLSCSSNDKLRLSRNVSGRSSARRSEAIACYPGSSLVVVLIQALTHPASFIWVIDEDHNLVGVVTFKEILKVFRSIANARLQT
ncbi:CBS domain-containing protein CBSX5-like [Capsicum galapagoense]